LGIALWRRARTSNPPALVRRADELKTILTRLRSANGDAALEEPWHSFERWMAANVARGRTGRADVVAWFGKPDRDLDRPPRDGVQTFEYLLCGDPTNGTWVAFDCDPKTGIVQDWQTSSSICGFCPHILASDGRWRLEGKMLAGRIGPSRAGPDTLLLPRLVPRDQVLRIRLANWAPELEYIENVQLGIIRCDSGEEVDLSGAGQPFLWKNPHQVELELARHDVGRDEWKLSLGGPEPGRVIVLEVRNTGPFERAMRKVVFKADTPWPRASLDLGFDDGGCQEVLPVGTKFLRRIVVPVSPGARTLRLSAPKDTWLIRRAWLGQGEAAQEVAWISATDPSGGEAPAITGDPDEPRLVLAPMQDADLSFVAPAAVLDNLRYRFVLRLSGYYELRVSVAGNMR
jgi:hypothetical protein